MIAPTDIQRDVFLQCTPVIDRSTCRVSGDLLDRFLWIMAGSRFCKLHLSEDAHFRAMWLYLKSKYLESGARIAIKGGGEHTEKILSHAKKDEPCLKNIVAILDRDQKKSNRLGHVVLPTDRARGLDVDKILLSTAVHQESMTVELRSLGVPEEKLLDLHSDLDFLKFLWSGAREQIETEIAEISREVDQWIHQTSEKNLSAVVYVVHHLPVNALKIIDALQKHGIRILVLSLNTFVSGLDLEQLELNFPILHVKNILALPGIIYNTRPIAFHAINFMFHSYVGALVNVYGRSTNIVSELVDVTALAFDDPEKLAQYTDADLEICSEEITWSYSDTVTSHYDDLCKQVLTLRYKIDPRFVHFCYYAIPQPQVERSDRRGASSAGTLGREALRIVFVGGCHHKHANNDATELHQSLLAVAKRLTDLGYRFDLYNAFDNGKSECWSNFKQFSRDNRLFNYFTAVDIRVLERRLVDYDLGWYILDFSKGRMNKVFYESALSSKFFVYIGVGLPILISPEQVRMAELVDKYQMGAVLPFDDIERLPQILTPTNLEKWRKNLSRAQSDFSMEKHIPRLVDCHLRTRSR